MTRFGWREMELAPGEWRAGLGLLFTAALTVWLLSSGDVVQAAQGPEDLRRLGRTALCLLAAWGLASTLLASGWTHHVHEDERDRQIVATAERWGRGALVLSNVGVIATLGLTPPDRLAWATPLTVAHLLLFALLWGSVVEYATSAILYVRDRWA